MAVTVHRRSHWNGPSRAFTHKLAASTWILSNCSHSWVIHLLPGRRGPWGVISTYASVYKTHTLLTLPSRQETSGWKWEIRQRAAALGAAQDASPPCWLHRVETGPCALSCGWQTSSGSRWSLVSAQSLFIWVNEQTSTTQKILRSERISSL